MTTYRSHGYLETVLRNISSYLSMTGESYEFCISDNESDDGTQELLLKLSNELPIKWTTLRCTRGLGRNVSIGLASGDKLLFLDADNVLTKNFTLFFKFSSDNDAIFALGGYLVKNLSYFRLPEFPDSNYNEDTVFFYKLMLSKIRISYLPIEIANNWEREHRQSFRERRYTVGTLDYLRRVWNIQRDFIINSNMSFTDALKVGKLFAFLNIGQLIKNGNGISRNIRVVSWFIQNIDYHKLQIFPRETVFIVSVPKLRGYGEILNRLYMELKSNGYEYEKEFLNHWIYTVTFKKKEFVNEH